MRSLAALSWYHVSAGRGPARAEMYDICRNKRKTKEKRETTLEIVFVCLWNHTSLVSRSLVCISWEFLLWDIDPTEQSFKPTKIYQKRRESIPVEDTLSNHTRQHGNKVIQRHNVAVHLINTFEAWQTCSFLTTPLLRPPLPLCVPWKPNANPCKIENTQASPHLWAWLQCSRCPCLSLHCSYFLWIDEVSELCECMNSAHPQA